MGSNAAVVLAEIYMYYTYDKIIKNLMHNEFNFIYYFKRYIDDYLLILIKCDSTKFNQFINALPNDLKINWDTPTESANFLDINISFLRDNFETTLHQKSLNKYLYITPHSMHSQHTFSGFIKGELIRYARLSSNIYKFINLKIIFYERLRRRGFAHSFLTPIFKRTNWTVRYENIYKSKNKTIAFVIPHTQRAGNNTLIYNFNDISGIKTY